MAAAAGYGGCGGCCWLWRLLVDAAAVVDAAAWWMRVAMAEAIGFSAITWREGSHHIGTCWLDFPPKFASRWDLALGCCGWPWLGRLRFFRLCLVLLVVFVPVFVYLSPVSPLVCFPAIVALCRCLQRPRALHAAAPWLACGCCLLLLLLVLLLLSLLFVAGLAASAGCCYCCCRLLLLLVAVAAVVFLSLLFLLLVIVLAVGVVVGAAVAPFWYSFSLSLAFFRLVSLSSACPLSLPVLLVVFVAVCLVCSLFLVLSVSVCLCLYTLWPWPLLPSPASTITSDCTRLKWQNQFDSKYDSQYECSMNQWMR